MNDELLVALVRMAAQQRGLGMFSALGMLYELSPRQAPKPAQRMVLFGMIEADGERWAVEPVHAARRITTRRERDTWTVTRIDLAARSYQVAPIVLQLPQLICAPRLLGTVPETVVYPVRDLPPFAHLVATVAIEPGRIQNFELVTPEGDRLGLWIQPRPIDADEILDNLEVPSTFRRQDEAS
jgi:hypothetical protein